MDSRQQIVEYESPEPLTVEYLEALKSEYEQHLQDRIIKIIHVINREIAANVYNGYFEYVLIPKEKLGDDLYRALHGAIEIYKRAGYRCDYKDGTLKVTYGHFFLDKKQVLS